MAEGLAVAPRFVSAVLLLFSLAAGRTGAQPVPPAPALGELLVPGGIARLFRAANLNPARDHAYALPTLSRLVYQEPLGEDSAQDHAARQLREYLDVLGQWCIRAAPFEKGLSLGGIAGAGESSDRLEDLLASGGLSLSKSGGRRLVSPGTDPDARRRRAQLSAAGIDLDGLAAELNAGATVDVRLRGDTVPLPLAESTWLETIFGNRVPRAALFALIIGEREALWLYCGLLGLDAETLKFLEGKPELLAWIHRNRPALFGAFGRSLRVRGGRVETPGEAGDAAIWESLAGAPAADAARFVRALLQCDAGRAAWFYDTVAHLPPERQAAFGPAAGTDPGARLAWFRTLYSVFLAFHPPWDVARHPFVRRPVDPTLALHLVEMKPGGRVAGPGWLPFWQHALTAGSFPDHPPETFAHLERGEMASVPSILKLIFGAPTPEHRAVLDRVLFAGRLFEGIDQARAFDALVALHGFARAPALMLVLERMGVRDPQVLAEAARAGNVISASADDRTRVVRLVQFQAALALVDRLCEVHALEAHAATTLARGLFRARPAADGWYQGAIVAWLDQQLLPALALPGGAETAEARLMIALAGMARVPARSAPAVEWEGQPYHVDLARTVLARLLHVREKQGGTTLDDVLAAWRRPASTSGTPVGSEPGTGAATSEAAKDVMVPQQASTLLGSPLSASDPLPRRVDRAAAEWLASLAYAVRVENVNAPVLLARNPALTHDLRVLRPRMGEVAQTSWTISTEAASEGLHLEGSLLGLSLPLSRYAVIRLETGTPPRRPTLDSNGASLLTASVSAFLPLDVTDEERDLIAAAIRRGRERVSLLAGQPGGWTSMAGELSADAWERQLIPWMLRHEPDRVLGRFSAHDLFVLGGGTADGAGRWGMLGRPVDGSLLPRPPAPALRRVLANQGSPGVLLTQFCDLHFRVAEFLSDSRLPASLGRAILAVAVPEFLERAVLSHDTDWQGIVEAARTLTNERLGHYVSALTTDGPLVRDATVPAPRAAAPEPARSSGESR